MSYFERYRELLQTGINACRIRGYWSPFQESPASKNHPSGAKEAGKQEFERYLNKPFPLTQPGTIGHIGSEVSPLTRQRLGITYPKIDIPIAMQAATTA